MKPTIDHVILTRFNLPSKGVESLIRAQEGWLRDRQVLFEKYCLPSVRQQTLADFKWVIYFDPESPQWLKDRIDQLSEDSTFFPIYREEVSPEQLLEDLDTIGVGRRDILLTTNLDNDDGLALDFVERLQNAVETMEETAVYIGNGLIQHGEKLYLRHDPVNAFCSVAAPWSKPRTCWLDWHNKLAEHMQTKEISGKPGWLQVIHETNVSNRVRGKLVGPEKYAGYFAGGLHAAATPHGLEFAKERLVLRPVRSVKEAFRKAVKDALVGIGGRDLLNKVKERAEKYSTVRR
ncbi:glycosyltransferase [Glutamicibacter ardleyensis]|uniref:Rhamnosyl transferase n=1 Tax=Glutamicibacter ardleyensis TaxID=225894 RepID=A0ABQ2DSH1_9MICC|nr:glycosyltransferase [Glutamicibacter ardleyensis]GGJ70788.1 hypothetical protein GCM10007173_32030 [Glutamicibacter ardleyensis]